MKELKSDSVTSATEPSMSRRNLLVKSGAVAGGILAAGQTLLGRENSNQGIPQEDLPITIDFSGLVASLGNGLTWIAEAGPVVELPFKEIIGHRQLVTFVAPSNGRETPPETYTIQFDFTEEKLAPLIAARQKSQEGRLDLITTGLAVYKVGKAFDVWRYRNNRYERTDEKLTLCGGVSFNWWDFLAKDKSQHLRSLPLVTLNVGNLLAAPTQGEMTKQFDKRQKTSYSIPKILFNKFDVQQTVSVTDDGENIYTCDLPVKELLGKSGSKKELGERISESDISTILTIADWIFYSKSAAKRGFIEGERISGTIGITFSI